MLQAAAARIVMGDWAEVGWGKLVLLLYIALVIEGRSGQAVTIRFVGSWLPTILTKTKTGIHSGPRMDRTQ